MKLPQPVQCIVRVPGYREREGIAVGYNKYTGMFTVRLKPAATNSKRIVLADGYCRSPQSYSSDFVVFTDSTPSSLKVPPTGKLSTGQIKG